MQNKCLLCFINSLKWFWGIYLRLNRRFKKEVFLLKISVWVIRPWKILAPWNKKTVHCEENIVTCDWIKLFSENWACEDWEVITQFSFSWKNRTLNLRETLSRHYSSFKIKVFLKKYFACNQTKMKFFHSECFEEKHTLVYGRFNGEPKCFVARSHLDPWICVPANVHANTCMFSETDILSSNPLIFK